MTVALPVIVTPVQAQEVRTEASQDFKDIPKKSLHIQRNNGNA